MKPSEMTNERIAEELIETIPHLSDEALSFTDADDILREAAARLRNLGEIGEAVGRQATREKSSQVGNAAKMREALEKIASMGEQIDYQLGSSEETVYALRHERCLAHNISECARVALASPPRNCDVGTVEEHTARHDKWCGLCHNVDICRLKSCRVCFSEWSQMPYEEGGAK